VENNIGAILRDSELLMEIFEKDLAVFMIVCCTKVVRGNDYQSDGGVKTACEYKGLFVVHIDGDTFFGLVECLCGHLRHVQHERL